MLAKTGAACQLLNLRLCQLWRYFRELYYSNTLLLQFLNNRYRGVHFLQRSSVWWMCNASSVYYYYYYFTNIFGFMGVNSAFVVRLSVCKHEFTLSEAVMKLGFWRSCVALPFCIGRWTTPCLNLWPQWYLTLVYWSEESLVEYFLFFFIPLLQPRT